MSVRWSEKCVSHRKGCEHVLRIRGAARQAGSSGPSWTSRRNNGIGGPCSGPVHYDLRHHDGISSARHPWSDPDLDNEPDTVSATLHKDDHNTNWKRTRARVLSVLGLSSEAGQDGSGRVVFSRHDSNKLGMGRHARGACARTYIGHMPTASPVAENPELGWCPSTSAEPAVGTHSTLMHGVWGRPGQRPRRLVDTCGRRPGSVRRETL